MSYDNQRQQMSVPENRRVERTVSELRTIVQVKENDERSWKEVTKVTTVSRNGAGFSLTKPCKVGRLITLVMPLDRELRAYDEDSELYPVMGLVQYCNEGMVDGKTIFHVGVGFVGKHIPESFKNNPTQNYRIIGMKKDGLWEIAEVELQYKNRKRPRYWISLPVTISLLQKAEQDITKEDTNTRNIGSGGVSVDCSLAAELGDKVKFACKSVDFYAIAVVRNRKQIKNDSPTLHLEFIETEFPVEKAVALQSAIFSDQ